MFFSYLNHSKGVKCNLSDGLQKEWKLSEFLTDSLSNLNTRAKSISICANANSNFERASRKGCQQRFHITERKSRS
jgi:hypothetical protein